MLNGDDDPRGGPGLGVGGAAVSLHDLSDNGEPKARPARIAARARLAPAPSRRDRAPIEAPEHEGELLLGNAEAVIADREAGPPMRLGGGVQPRLHPSPARDVAELVHQ